MRIHFIAIGGSAMHNLAIALHKKGFQVTGSDDEVFEPSRGRLRKYGLLPKSMGWNPDSITADIDSVILGMHARPDNPELIRAQELNLKVYSYPEYLYEQTKNKTRIVIAGSHGKTTITSMLLHVLKSLGRKFDFMVGAQIKGFDTMVELTDESEIAIFEGDEYLSSPIDRRPKFLWYKPHIALATGVAWDHINVFPTESEYNQQFGLFAQTIEPGGSFIYYEKDKVLSEIAPQLQEINVIPYNELNAKTLDGKTLVETDEEEYELGIFGHHNLQNLAGAMEVALKIGISKPDFLKAMFSFEGASRRLQVLAENDDAKVFFDFAHAPSKVRATVAAVKDQFPDRHLLAVLELHTFSSLNKDFLPQYKGAMNAADEAVVFFNPEVVKHKKLPAIDPDDVKKAFSSNGLNVYTNPDDLKQYLEGLQIRDSNLLLMTSGNLAGIDVQNLAERIV
ncbi:UDP-N-acetylmuramate--L-alanine ligase [Marinilabilia rubra]|uniref:Peptidoglycan synthetase n=1 Tax=Marinilabilia rubra TaxID=2162893 RepID=A0A2U2BDF1_9BACT|nr:Mur ligase family protein [Marinilabilia rubra]PWE01057.1 peptidoglycan synthetase [Marinilabilia rubra]